MLIKKKNFLINNEKFNYMSNKINLPKFPLLKDVNENASQNNICPLKDFLLDNQSNNSIENNLNSNFIGSINPNEISEANKANISIKANKEKLSDYIFLKKKLTRNNIAEIKTEYLNKSQKLILKKKTKKNKAEDAKKKQKNIKKGHSKANSKSENIDEGIF